MNLLSARYLALGQLVAFLFVLPTYSIASGAEASIESRVSLISNTHSWCSISPEFLTEIDNRMARNRGPKIDATGEIKSETGDPVAAALVVLRIHSNTTLTSNQGHSIPDVFAYQWADEHGRYKFDQVATPFIGLLETLEWDVVAFAPDHAVGVASHPHFRDGAYADLIQLEPAQEILGRVVDSEDRPIVGVELLLTQLIKGRNMDNLYFLTLLHSELATRVLTDANGDFRIGGLPPRLVAVIGTGWRTPQFKLLPYYRVPTSNDLDRRLLLDAARVRASEIYPLEELPLKIRSTTLLADLPTDYDTRNAEPPKTAPTRTAKVQVTDSKTGVGVSGITVDVSFQALDSANDMHPSFPRSVSDDDGKVELTIPQSACYLYAMGRRIGYLTPYCRFTTSTDEPVAVVDIKKFVLPVETGAEDVVIAFEIEPVKQPLLTLLSANGSPVQATVRLQDRWSGVQSPEFQTNELGQLTLAIRPIISEFTLLVTTLDGRKLEASVNSSEVGDEVTVHLDE